MGKMLITQSGLINASHVNHDFKPLKFLTALFTTSDTSHGRKKIVDYNPRHRYEDWYLLVDIKSDS